MLPHFLLMYSYVSGRPYILWLKCDVGSDGKEISVLQEDTICYFWNIHDNLKLV